MRNYIYELLPAPVPANERTMAWEYHEHPDAFPLADAMEDAKDRDKVIASFGAWLKEHRLGKLDGETLEINRCCTDPRYADVCSCLYARAVRIGREMGYRRFLTYILPEESGSSLRAVGFQPDGVTNASASGWNSPSRPRDTLQYPAGEKIRWILYAR